MPERRDPDEIVLKGSGKRGRLEVKVDEVEKPRLVVDDLPPAAPARPPARQPPRTTRQSARSPARAAPPSRPPSRPGIACALAIHAGLSAARADDDRLRRSPDGWRTAGSLRPRQRWPGVVAEPLGVGGGSGRARAGCRRGPGGGPGSRGPHKAVVTASLVTTKSAVEDAMKPVREATQAQAVAQALRTARSAKPGRWSDANLTNQKNRKRADPAIGTRCQRAGVPQSARRPEGRLTDTRLEEGGEATWRRIRAEINTAAEDVVTASAAVSASDIDEPSGGVGFTKAELDQTLSPVHRLVTNGNRKLKKWRSERQGLPESTGTGTGTCRSGEGIPARRRRGPRRLQPRPSGGQDLGEQCERATGAATDSACMAESKSSPTSAPAPTRSCRRARAGAAPAVERAPGTSGVRRPSRQVRRGPR